ncbi:hypothetical protein W04_2205 [Pseudoalteromonas sp. SW0106-04]|nr:hypothetical protein W04_2205 [Pseudoalteromonas sp. SW0106-04]
MGGIQIEPLNRWDYMHNQRYRLQWQSLSIFTTQEKAAH